MIAYTSAVFLGAFLLFQVQPLIARYILPWYGGSPAVWSTCLLFFQVVLVLGYAYAHFVTERLERKQQVFVHGAVLLIALVVLPITPNATWKPAGGGDPGTCQQLWDTRELHLVSLDYGGETREVGAIDVNIDQDLLA